MSEKRALLAAVALAAQLAMLGATPAAGAFAAVERFADGGHPMAPGPDGRLWLLGRSWPVGLQSRADELRVTLVGGGAQHAATPLTPLSDGSMAYVGDSDFRRRVLVRVAPGRQPDTRPLPTSRGYGPSAIAVDGTVWIDDLCAKRVIGAAPSGETRDVPIPGIDCASEGEAYPMIAVGGDGAVWVAHLCAGRIMRIPLVGSPRLWHVHSQPDLCSVVSAGVRPLHVAIEPTDAGGLRFPGGTVDAHGRVRGRPVVRFPDRLASTTAPDGRRWFVRAQYLWTPWDEFGWNVRLGARTADGTAIEQPLPPFSATGEGGVLLYGYPRMTAGPDGSVWIDAGERSGDEYARDLLRATPVPTTGPAPTPSAMVSRVLARRGPVVWVQLECQARPGLYCTGNVRLVGNSGGAAAFAVPGAETRPARLVLGRAQRWALRSRGRVAVDAVVRMGDGTPPRTTVLRLR